MFVVKVRHNKSNIRYALGIMYWWWGSQSKSDEIMIPRSLGVETLVIFLIAGRNSPCYASIYFPLCKLKEKYIASLVVLKISYFAFISTSTQFSAVVL